MPVLKSKVQFLVIFSQMERCIAMGQTRGSATCQLTNALTFLSLRFFACKMCTSQHHCED